MYWLIVLAVCVLDQLSKYIIRSIFTYGSSAVLIPDILEICYVRNEGAAFSMLQGRQEFLIIFTLAAIAALSFYANFPHFRVSRAEKNAMALICGGGIGNLICRFANGFVTDFINIHILPVFNVADIAICVGCGLLILAVFLQDGKQEKQSI